MPTGTAELPFPSRAPYAASVPQQSLPEPEHRPRLQSLPKRLHLLTLLGSATLLAPTQSFLSAQTPKPTPSSSLADFHREQLPTPSAWSRSLSTKTELGYRSNIGLSPFAEDKSAFATGGFELLLLRFPTDSDSTEASLYLSAEHRHYFSSEITDAEQSIIASSSLRHPISNRFSVGANLLYLFQDLVLDASSNDLEQGSVKAQAHVLALKPSLRYRLTPLTTLDFGPSLARHNFIAPLDDYWEYGTFGSLKFKASQASEVFLNLESKQRPYDHRSPADFSGFPIESENLTLEQHEASIGLTQRFGPSQTMRWTSKVGGLHSTDGSSGYYDYARCKLNTSLHAKLHPLTIDLDVYTAYTDYSIQQASATDPSTRTRIEFNVSLKPSLQITPRLKWYTLLEWERAWSNSPTDPYTAVTFATGFEIDVF